MAETRIITNEQPALEVVQLERIFGGKGNPTYALKGVSFQVSTGEFIGIMGPSGSGKTTLLNCISTIDRPTSGKVLVGGKDTMRLRGHALARFRREDLGFIFQDSNLLDTLNGFENIALPLSIRGTSPFEIQKTVDDVAKRFNISEVLEKFPNQMSGGQRQRVAAARAIIGKPKLILADEPTGALDSRNATVMLETLTDMNQDMGATILMVTHDAFAASHAHRIIFLKDGKIFTELSRGNDSRTEFFTRLMDVQAFLGGNADYE